MKTYILTVDGSLFTAICKMNISRSNWLGYSLPRTLIGRSWL
jgi:hypothetical protein